MISARLRSWLPTLAAMPTALLDCDDTIEIPISPMPESLNTSSYVSRHLNHESKRLDKMPTIKTPVSWWRVLDATL